MFPTIDRDAVPWITGSDMVEVDRIMIDELGIELLQMMENAGRSLARLVIERFAPTSVAVVAGSGGNGGGGLAAARHLANAGVDVTVTTTRPIDQMTQEAAHQAAILHRMTVPTRDEPPGADVVVDALIGYSLRGAPTGRSAELIERINAQGTVVALDTPSGLDVTGGRAPGAVVTADATLTLALPKVGLRTSRDVGELYLADISVPRSVTGRYGSAPPDFRAGPILRVS